MQSDNPQNLFILILLTLLTACTKQSWYAGAQSAQTAHCMKGPASEYEDCIKQSNQDYDEYSKKREQLLKENQGN